MLTIKNIKIDAKQTLGRQLLLVGVQPVNKYVNGKPTDEIEGYKYNVVLPERNFEKIAIKILGRQLIEAPNGYLEVEFEGLEVYLYWWNGKYELGARATGVTATKR